MLIDFFYTLRAGKLPVSVKEFLTLLEALQAGVVVEDQVGQSQVQGGDPVNLDVHGLLTRSHHHGSRGRPRFYARTVHRPEGPTGPRRASTPDRARCAQHRR